MHARLRRSAACPPPPTTTIHLLFLFWVDLNFLIGFVSLRLPPPPTVSMTTLPPTERAPVRSFAACCLQKMLVLSCCAEAAEQQVPSGSPELPQQAVHIHVHVLVRVPQDTCKGVLRLQRFGQA